MSGDEALSQRPSAYDCWQFAGGGTDDYDRDEYLRLLRLHGHLVHREPGDTMPVLPCGWPSDKGSSVTPSDEPKQPTQDRASGKPTSSSLEQL